MGSSKAVILMESLKMIPDAGISPTSLFADATERVQLSAYRDFRVVSITSSIPAVDAATVDEVMH